MKIVLLVALALMASAATGCADGGYGGGSGYHESSGPDPMDMRFWSFGQKQEFKRMIGK